MLVVVPLSALTDHTLKAPELLSGLITAPPPLLPTRTPPAPLQPYVNYYLCSLLITCTYSEKVRQTPAILLNIGKLLLNFRSALWDLLMLAVLSD